MDTLKNFFQNYNFVELYNIYVEKLILFMSNFLQLSYDYLYPYSINYIILLKTNILNSILIIFLLFNIFYFWYIYNKKYNFNIYLYFLLFMTMPISTIILFILFLDSFIKKYIIYKIFNLEYPYVEYRIKKDLIDIERILKNKSKYLERFKKNNF